MPPKINKVEAELKKLTKLDGNKTCADCPEKLPGYADLTHNIFVCTRCSGMHRNHQFRIKGVSMSTFSEDEVIAIAKVGNEEFNKIYLARLNPREYTLPNGSDENKLKEFIKQKYIDKRWHRDTGSGISHQSFSAFEEPDKDVGFSSSTVSSPAADSNRISINLKKQTSVSASRRASTGSVGFMQKQDDITHGLDLMSLSTPSAPAAANTGFDPFASNSASKSSNNLFGESNPQNNDPFGANQQTDFDPFGASSQSNGSAGFDAFGTSATSASAQTHFDPFGSHNPAAGFAQFDQNAHVTNNAATYTQQQQQPAVMPFIRTAPPPPPTTTTSSQPEAPKATTKNFSAFDDLMSDHSVPAPALTESNNPFDNPHLSTHAQNSHPYASYPAGNVGYSQPYGAVPYPPQQYLPQQYPPQQFPSHQYPPQQFPPQQYPAQQGFPLQSHSQQAPGYYPGGPVPPNNYPPNYYPAQAAAPYGQPPNPAHALAPHPPQQLNTNQPPVPAQPKQNDPFAAMSDLAWNAVGGTTSNRPGNAPPNPTSQQIPTAAPMPFVQPVSAPPSTAPESVNPFDLF